MRSEFRKMVDGRCVPIQSCAILCVNEVDCHRERTSTRSVPTKPMTSHFGACCFQRAVPKVDTNDIGSKNAFRPTRSIVARVARCPQFVVARTPSTCSNVQTEKRDLIHHASTWYILCLSRKAVRDIASHAYFTTRGWRGNTNNLHSSTRMKTSWREMSPTTPEKRRMHATMHMPQNPASDIYRPRSNWAPAASLPLSTNYGPFTD